jgi:hypothetical protein
MRFVILQSQLMLENIKISGKKQTSMSHHQHSLSTFFNSSLSFNSFSSIFQLTLLDNTPCVKAGAADVHESIGVNEMGSSLMLVAAKEA